MIIRRTLATVLATTVGLATPGVAQAMPGVDRIPGADAVQACVQKQGLEDREPGWINRYGEGKSYADAGQEYQNSSAPSCYSAEQLSQILVDITQDLVNGIDIQGAGFQTPGVVPIKNTDWISSSAGFGDNNLVSQKRFEVRDRFVSYLHGIGVDTTEVSRPWNPKTPENQYVYIEAYVYPVADAPYKLSLKFDELKFDMETGARQPNEDFVALQVVSPSVVSRHATRSGEQTFYAQ